MGGSCHGASDHGPLSWSANRAVLGPARNSPILGHDLRGSPHGGCLKPWSRPPQPPTFPTTAPPRPRGRRTGPERGGDRSGGPGEPGRAASGASLDEVGKLVPRGHPEAPSGSQEADAVVVPDVRAVFAQGIEHPDCVGLGHALRDLVSGQPLDGC